MAHISASEHISYFNDRNIRLFLENNGFEVLEIKTVHKMFSCNIFSIFFIDGRIVFMVGYVTRFLKKAVARQAR